MRYFYCKLCAVVEFSIATWEVCVRCFIVLDTNKSSAKFFLYVSNGKYFEELFTLIFNRIVASGWYVFFASVVQHARLLDWLRRMQRNKTVRNEENQI